MSYLHKKYGLSSALLEGGSGNYELSLFTSIRNKNIRKRTADYFMKNGRINGAELYAIENQSSIKLMGLENSHTYIKNLDAYLKSLFNKKDAYFVLDNFSGNINKLKENYYTDTLKTLEIKKSEYFLSNSAGNKYISYLAYLAEKNNLSLDNYPNILLHLKLIEKESEINFKEAEVERNLLAESTLRLLGTSEARHFTYFITAFYKGTSSPEKFYSYLLKKVFTSGLDKTLVYTNITSYKEYLSLAGIIDKDLLLSELLLLHDKVAMKLCDNNMISDIYIMDKRIKILRSLFDMEITPEEYKYYIENKNNFTFDSLLLPLKKEGTHIVFKWNSYQVKAFADMILHMDNFYKYAFQRDKAFLRNISLHTEKHNITAIVTGGFHSKNLSEILKQKGYSYINILPRFDHNENTPYFEMISGGMSPLERSINASFSSMAVYSIFSELKIDALKLYSKDSETSWKTAEDTMEIAIEAVRKILEGRTIFLIKNKNKEYIISTIESIPEAKIPLNKLDINGKVFGIYTIESPEEYERITDHSNRIKTRLSGITKKSISKRLLILKAMDHLLSDIKNVPDSYESIKTTVRYISDILETGLISIDDVKDHMPIEIIKDLLYSNDLRKTKYGIEILSILNNSGLLDRPFAKKITENIPVEIFIHEKKDKLAVLNQKSELAFLLSIPGLLNDRVKMKIRENIPYEFIISSFNGGYNTGLETDNMARILYNYSFAGILDIEKIRNDISTDALIKGIEKPERKYAKTSYVTALARLIKAGIINRDNLSEDKKSVLLSYISDSLKNENTAFFNSSIELFSELVRNRIISKNDIQQIRSIKDILVFMTDKDDHPSDEAFFTTMNSLAFTALKNIFDTPERMLLFSELLITIMSYNQDGQYIESEYIRMPEWVKKKIFTFVFYFSDGASRRTAAEALKNFSTIISTPERKNLRLKITDRIPSLAYKMDRDGSSLIYGTTSAVKHLLEGDLIKKESVSVLISQSIITSMIHDKNISDSAKSNILKDYMISGLITDDGLDKLTYDKINDLFYELYNKQLSPEYYYFFLRFMENLKDDIEALSELHKYLTPEILYLSRELPDEFYKKASHKIRENPYISPDSLEQHLRRYFQKLITEDLQNKDKYTHREPSSKLGRLISRSYQKLEALPEYIGKAFKTFSIEFKNTGNTISTFSVIVESCLKDLPVLKFIKMPFSDMKKKQDNIETISPEHLPVIADRFKDARFYGVRGRTLIYEATSGASKKFIALKFLKENEDPEKLINESAWFRYLNEIKSEGADLRGKYPLPHDLVGGNSTARIEKGSLPAVINIQLQKNIIDKGELKIDTSNNAFTIMAYETDSPDYFTYLHEIKDDIEAENASVKNIHDLFLLARYGWIHPDIIELFHAQGSQKREDKGRYLCMVDMIRYMASREGSGDIPDWEKTVKYPNFRVSGPADFAEMIRIEDLINFDNEHSAYLKNNLKLLPEEKRNKFILAHFMSNYLLSIVLNEGKRLKDAGKLDYKSPDRLAETLKEIYSSAHSAFTGSTKKDSDNIADIIDWKMLSRQMHFFMGNYYKGFIDRDIPENIMGIKGLRIIPGLEWGFIHRKVIEKALKENPETAAIDPEQVIDKYFKEAKSLDVPVKDNIFVFKENFEELIQEENHKALRNILNALYPEFSIGWKETGEYDQLGPFNGPLPLTEMVRANYIYAMDMIARYTVNPPEVSNRSEQKDKGAEKTLTNNYIIDSSKKMSDILFDEAPVIATSRTIGIVVRDRSSIDRITSNEFMRNMEVLSRRVQKKIEIRRGLSSVKVQLGDIKYVFYIDDGTEASDSNIEELIRYLEDEDTQTKKNNTFVWILPESGWGERRKESMEKLRKISHIAGLEGNYPPVTWQAFSGFLFSEYIELATGNIRDMEKIEDILEKIEIFLKMMVPDDKFGGIEYLLRAMRNIDTINIDELFNGINFILPLPEALVENIVEYRQADKKALIAA